MTIVTDEKQPMREKLERWLGEHGYPFEMEVAEEFRNAGFEAWQADFVLSNDGKTLREVDVAASLASQVFHHKDGKDGRSISLGGGLYEATPLELLPPSIHWEVLVVAECKQPKGHPWVMFSSEPRPMEILFAHLNRLGTPAALALLQGLGVGVDVPALLDPPSPYLFGHAIVQAFGDGKVEHPSSPYHASLQVLDQAQAYCRVADGDDATMRTCRLVLPILVVDSPLFECFLDEDGARHLEERTHLRLYWRRTLGPGAFTIVDVVNRAGLGKFIESVVELHQHFKARPELLHAAVLRPDERTKPRPSRRATRGSGRKKSRKKSPARNRG